MGKSEDTLKDYGDLEKSFES